MQFVRQEDVRERHKLKQKVLQVICDEPEPLQPSKLVPRICAKTGLTEGKAKSILVQLLDEGQVRLDLQLQVFPDVRPSKKSKT